MLTARRISGLRHALRSANQAGLAWTGARFAAAPAAETDAPSGSSSSSSSTSNSSSSSSGIGGLASWFRPKEEGPKRHLLRLQAPAQLYREAAESAEVLEEVPAGELLIAVGAPEAAEPSPQLPEWLLVRVPAEDSIDVMSDKPLQYQDGWVRRPEVELAPLQLGDRVAARMEVHGHPVLNCLRQLPPWKGPDGEALPLWIRASVSELHTGKVDGVVKSGRFLVQRAAGAIPERVAGELDMFIRPKDRARQTFKAAALGLGLAAAFGLAGHTRGWLRGESMDSGRVAWPKLIGWLTLATVFLTPATAMPCFVFANSTGSTTCVVAWINLLLYADLFWE